MMMQIIIYCVHKFRFFIKYLKINKKSKLLSETSKQTLWL